ncbi:MAG TPA: tetratricopeptide repeat protein, partial [Acidimicrobiales bacterium]
MEPGGSEEALGQRLAVGGGTGVVGAEELEQVLALVPDEARAVVALADLWVEGGRADEALELLTRIPESPETRRVAAKARTGEAAVDGGEISGRLDGLLDRVKDDDDAR